MNRLLTDRMGYSPRRVKVNGAIIVGAGSSGLGVAARLRVQGVPFAVLEREDGIGALWENRTDVRLKMPLPKTYCELPGMPVPEHYPEYLTGRQAIDYLQEYASKHGIEPVFNTTVKSARYDETGLWRVSATANGGDMEYIGRWLVVATGENAKAVVPNIPGLDEFDGQVIHVSAYKSGEAYAGKSVLVVGCGNSGMEVSLDLADYGARPAMAVRDKSTMVLAATLNPCLPLWIVHKIVALHAFLGNLSKLGLRRPAAGPLELKEKFGRNRVLDYDALARIRAGDIAFVPAVRRFGKGGKVEVADGRALAFDAIILDTGYRSNVPQAEWQQLEDDSVLDKEGYPNKAFPHGWKGQSGLYAVGFTRRGLPDAASDAVRVAKDIGDIWKEEMTDATATTAGRCVSVIF